MLFGGSPRHANPTSFCLKSNMIRSLQQHWPEYLMEAACLGTFMISAGLFTALLEYPDSPVRHAIPNDFVRLALNGLAMGLRRSASSTRLGERGQGRT